MRKIVGGKVFDTTTADLVCDISPKGFSRGDFQFEETHLYKSPKGNFFISGTGGPRSHWAQPEGTGGSRGGSGLEVIAEAEARALCERHGSDDDFVTAFGPAEVG